MTHRQSGRLEAEHRVSGVFGCESVGMEGLSPTPMVLPAELALIVGDVRPIEGGAWPQVCGLMSLFLPTRFSRDKEVVFFVGCTAPCPHVVRGGSA